MKIRNCILSAATAACMAVSAVCTGNITVSAKSGIREYRGSLPVNGDTFTVMSYSADDLDVMLPMWEEAHGIDKGKVKLINFQIGGGEASEAYERYFLGGNDVDVFLAEPDWALKYLNDSEITVPMSELGFSDDDFSDQYAYSRELCRATAGKNRGKQMASMYDISAGVWCYRADLAEKYLGVTSPDEMQELVSDWDGFERTAADVYTASKGKTALTASLWGMWDAYECGNTAPLVKNNSPVVNSFHDRFIDLAKNMWDKGYISHNDQWTDNWYAAGESDDVMGYFVPTWGFGDAILNCAAGGQKGKTYGKWAACRGPQAYYWGGVMMCAFAKTDNADLAADFIDYFTVDKKGMRTYTDTRSTSFGAYYMPNSQSVTQDILYSEYNGLGVLGGESALEALDANAKAIDIKGTITPYDSGINTGFIDTVDKYCKGNIDSKSKCIDIYKGTAIAHLPETADYTTLKGDADLDGEVGLSDVTAVSKFCLSNTLYPFINETAYSNADMNYDGIVDVLDISALIEINLGK